MPVLYKPFQSKLETREKKRLFYPRVVLKGNVDTRVIAAEIAGYSSLTSGDVKNTIDNLVTVMAKHLQASESVTLDGLGTFRPVLLSRKPGFETADAVRPSVSVLTVRFSPAVTRNADRTVATRSMTTGAVFARYEPDEETASAPAGGGEDDDEGTAPEPVGQ